VSRLRPVGSDDVTETGSVLSQQGFLSGPHPIALVIGAGRLLLGAAFLASPVASMRVLGLDSATAKRITVLARMAAARDIGLGAGTLAAGTLGRADGADSAGPGGVAWWLVAGAFADAVDAAVIAGALRRGALRGLPATGVAVGAAMTAAAALRAAGTARRGQR
jgi:hypothetical protein